MNAKTNGAIHCTLNYTIGDAYIQTKNNVWAYKLCGNNCGTQNIFTKREVYYVG